WLAARASSLCCCPRIPCCSPYTTLFRSWRHQGPVGSGRVSVPFRVGVPFRREWVSVGEGGGRAAVPSPGPARGPPVAARAIAGEDRKSTRLNSSHVKTAYAVFGLKKKNN